MFRLTGYSNSCSSLLQIMRDPETGNSRGFGFISYDSFEASDAAIEVCASRAKENLYYIELVEEALVNDHCILSLDFLFNCP